VSGHRTAHRYSVLLIDSIDCPTPREPQGPRTRAANRSWNACGSNPSVWVSSLPGSRSLQVTRPVSPWRSLPPFDPEAFEGAATSRRPRRRRRQRKPSMITSLAQTSPLDPFCRTRFFGPVAQEPPAPPCFAGVVPAAAPLDNGFPEIPASRSTTAIRDVLEDAARPGLDTLPARGKLPSSSRCAGLRRAVQKTNSTGSATVFIPRELIVTTWIHIRSPASGGSPLASR